jgi:hypothetical protein
MWSSTSNEVSARPGEPTRNEVSLARRGCSSVRPEKCESRLGR